MSDQDAGLEYVEDRVIEQAVMACIAHPDPEEGKRLLAEMKAGNWRIKPFHENGELVLGVVVDGIPLVAVTAEPEEPAVPGYI